MIVFRKTHNNFFEYSEELTWALYLIPFFIVLFVLAYEYDTVKTYYGKVDTLWVDKYETPPVYNMRIDFRELEEYKEYKITQEEYNSFFVGKIIKKEIHSSSISGKGLFLNCIYATSVIGLIIFFFRALFFGGSWIINKFQNYSFTIISKKKYKLIKEIDPYLEEIWE